MAETDGDAWDFLAPRKREVSEAGSRSADEVPEAEGRSADPLPAPADEESPDWGAIAVGGSARRARGELRAEMGGASLKQRAWPLAAALIAVSFAGFLTEVVAASQMLSLAGASSLIYMYPLGGVGLIAVALLQFRFIDHRARLPMLRAVGFGYAIAFAIALVFISQSVWQVGATGIIWLLADQLNFLVPLLIWSLAGDEFNVAEGRKVFGWIVAWTYAGQLGGLAVSTVAPSLMTPSGVPLWWLLVVDPIVCVAVAWWLPHRLRGTAAAKGTAKETGVGESLKGAWEFIEGVPVWKSLLVASIITFAATMTAHLSFLGGLRTLLGTDAGTIQAVLGGVTLGVFVVSFAIQKLWAQRIQDRLGIPGTLMILPIMAVIAGLLLAVGVIAGSVALLIVGIAFVRIPRWTVDENTRRAALALVPDERRARVSFFVDLGPVALGLIIAGPLGLIALLTGQAWIAPLLAAVIAVCALPWQRKVISGWEDSLMNWRLRRRKQNRALDLGGDEPIF